MNTYTLHVPEDARPGDADALAKADVVKDGFAWIAFLLGPFGFLWFLFQRLWIAGIGVLVILVAFQIGLRSLGADPVAAFFAELLLAILIGLEANSLKRWTYARRGRPAVDAVLASDQDQAAVKAFGRWLAARPAPGPAAALPAATLGSVPPPAGGAFSYRPGIGEPVIGLFPDSERGR
jgi:hypothetical protein